MDLQDIIRFQIINYCFINDINLSPNQIRTLTLLGEWGEINISTFCQQISDLEIYSSAQTVRNFIIDSIKTGIVIRQGKGEKLISITKDVELLNSGNIIIHLKVYTNATSNKS